MMSPFPFVTFLLGLSLVSAINLSNLTTVYEWPDKIEYDWPSETFKTKVIQDTSFEFNGIHPRFMAVSQERIFLSLAGYGGLPASLVFIPTNSTSSSLPPSLAPYPSWEMHNNDICGTIQSASGLEVDKIGQLWVLDNGSKKCNAKIWIFDLANSDKIQHVHEFPFHLGLHDLVLDETPDGWFAYITRFEKEHIVIFSLKTNKSWLLDTPGKSFLCLALSPKQETRLLYLGRLDSNELYAISASEIRDRKRTAHPKLIGKWNQAPYRMLMDGAGVMQAAFFRKKYTSTWNTSLPFAEKPFIEVETLYSRWPFAFASGTSRNLWITAFNWNAKPRYRLLKDGVGAGKRSYLYDASKFDCLEGCHDEHGYCSRPGECLCKVGWKGNYCDECHPYPGCVNGTCNKPWECNCEASWEGMLCDKTLCNLTCNLEHGSCVDTGECLCKTGWKGENCDECQSYPGCTNGTCSQPWQCNCAAGFHGKLCDLEDE
ncbi:protein yellow-like [Cloeon dipterum]|uniref:protein yellow-like n=1 Tax=Cloeon dipterum TaxID=197152 RepID=UPI0032207AD8